MFRVSPYSLTSATGPGRASAQSLLPASALLLAATLLLSSVPLQAQATANTPEDAAKNAQNASKPALPRVTTTVVVHEDLRGNYLPQNVSTGSLDNLPLQKLPSSMLVIDRAILADQNARLLNEVIKNDASVGEDYAPVGYYGVYELRGFPIDLASALSINGLTIAGEQEVPLENKESVEILKGIAGVEYGVASAGGAINFTTKRPALVSAVDMATDHRGTAFGAGDFGRLFGHQKQVGASINLAGESIQSYVNNTDGWRAMGAGAADWHITPLALLKGDFEYQHKVEGSVCGYQLLGGNTLPDISRLHPSTLLGEQSWTKPNTFDTHNSNARFDYQLPHGWKAFAAAAYSHSLIDDNVIYPYGCSESVCDNVTAPYYFFAPDGGYDIYDYRNPGELRINAQAEAMATGTVSTGKLQHDLAIGGSLFRRSVQQPSKSVNEWIGSENIYQPIEAFGPETTKTPGDRILDEDNHQAALILQDRIHLPGRIQLLVAGREDSLRDHDKKATALVNGVVTDGVNTDKMVWLPQYAITFQPTDELTLYGNYSVQLSLGLQAPWWTDNSSFYLAPYFTRQTEIGAKFQPTANLLTSVAIFRMHAPFFYNRVLQVADSYCDYNYNYGEDVQPGDLCFEAYGRESHDGIEFSAQGRAAHWLSLTASATALKATAENSGTAAYDGKQILNTPHLRTAVFADVLVPHAHGLHLMPGWNYTGRKSATSDGSVSVDGYNIFNLGARYSPGGESSHVTLRLYADNILNKRYWKATGANYGDSFLHMGAPTTVRLSAHYSF